MKPTVTTSSKDAEFMTYVSGEKVEKYMISILEELGFRNYELTRIFCGNLKAIIMDKYKKTTYGDRQIYILTFNLQ